MRAEQHPEGVLGVVADVIDIPQEYERAVAAVLGERLQYVIVRGEEEGAARWTGCAAKRRAAVASSR